MSKGLAHTTAVTFIGFGAMLGALFAKAGVDWRIIAYIGLVWVILGGIAISVGKSKEARVRSHPDTDTGPPVGREIID